jgi:YD repeat-containing protein
VGRLVQVIENQTSWNGSTVGKSTYPMYQTAYSYDPLDDLLGVNQSGQTRSFTCDWLKRLLTSNNPETGLISYNYDKINNLTTKKDNRGITTTLLNYDGLNRPQQKTYSDGVTPTVTYCYDGQTSGCSAATESAGQMLGHLTYVGNSSSFTQFTNFLPRGLVGSSTQTTGLPSFPLPTLAFSYTYSLTEKLLPETYPSGKVVSTSYDLDDRIAGVTGPAGAYATLNATPSLAYTPDGKIENFTYGSPLTESRSYDANTLLPTGVQITKGSTQLLQLGFGYAASPQNNGNIISQTISAPSPDLPGTLTQAYQYDQVNRLALAFADLCL